MPSVSPKQHRFMEAIAHGMKPKGGKGPSVSVAKDFAAADKGKKFDSGGTVKKRKGVNPGMLAAMAGPPPGVPMGGPPPGPMPGGPGGPAPGMKHGGVIHHHHYYAKGGKIETKFTKKMSSKMLREKKDAGGKGIARKGETKARVVKMASGGMVGSSHRGDGVAQRGHTRGTMR